jgi:hypothetical protein
MSQEIERKFLVKNNDFKKESVQESKIIQGFLSSVPERTVRIRIKDDRGFVTVKGIGNASGTTRFEWEKEISLKDAINLLKISEPGFVGVAGFEPATSASQTRRDNRATLHPDERLIRRLKRDISERGRDIDEVLARYQTTLKPMHDQFIEPMKEYADMIIPNNKHNNVAIDIVRTIINEKL